MKPFILILLLFSFNSFAGYMSKTHLDNCDSLNRTFYLTNKTLCETEQSDICPTVPENYHCKTYSEQDTDVDDFTKPQYSKSETEVCSGSGSGSGFPDSCTVKIESKTCTDNQESKYINQDYTEIYCSKRTGYAQKTIKTYREDAAKKTAYEANQAAKNALESAVKSKFKLMDCGKRIMALMSLSSDVKNLTIGQRRQILTTYKDIKNELDAGSLNVAKDSITSITPDGTLVTAADKTTLLAEIDKCLE